MNAVLQKRLEEAADTYADKHGFRVPYDGSNNFYDETDVKASKDGFLAGAKQGYKEAIKVAKEWLKEYTLTNHTANGNICTVFFETKKELLTNFESDMNKLWEEKK